SILKVGQGFPAFFCGPEPVEIIYSYRKILQPFGKCFMMLKCKYSSWYQNSDLLSIIYSFKSCANCNFGLSEANIPAHQAVHRLFVFHILLNCSGSGCLVRSVFINKGGFQLMLKVGIGTKGKSFLQPSLGV